MASTPMFCGSHVSLSHWQQRCALACGIALWATVTAGDDLVSQDVESGHHCRPVVPTHHLLASFVHTP